MSNGVAEIALRRDRIIVLSGLAAIMALSWAYVASLASDMQNMDVPTEIAMPQMQAWGITNFALTFVMWAVIWSP